MNNDSPFTAIGDEPVEARIVAWVLGEASAFEAAELERLCEERPELLVFRRRMRALHGLLTEAEAKQPDDGWKLPEEKRKVLDEIFGDGKIVSLDVEKEKRIRHSGRRAMLAIAACVMIAFVILSVAPRKYRAEAIIEVKPRSVGMSPLGANFTDESGARMMTPMFFGTEFEKIKSRNSLEKVVDNLELENRWNVDKETALARLKSSVETKQVPGTDLISISARDANPEVAKEIAEEVSNSYKEYRGALQKKSEEQALTKLRKAVQNQEDKVEERRKVLSTIARTKGIINRGEDSIANQSGVDEDQGAKSALESYHQLEQQKMQLESQIKSLEKYDKDQLAVYASGLDLPDNVVRDTFPKFNEAKRELDGLKASGLDEDHPTVKAKTGEAEAMKRQIDQGVVNLRDTLKAQLDLAADRLKSAEVMKDDAREEAIKRGLDAQDYVDAKRDFETDQELLQAMKLKLIGEDTSSDMAGESVELHQDAVVSKKKENPIQAATAEIKELFKSNKDTPAAQPQPSSPVPVAEPMARPQIAAAVAVERPVKVNAPAGPEIAMLAESDADPFAEKAVSTSRLAARKPLARAGAGTLSIPSGGVVGGGLPNEALAESTSMGTSRSAGVSPAAPAADAVPLGNRSGSGIVEKGNIDKILDDTLSIAGEKATDGKKQPEQTDEAPGQGDMPVLGGLFSNQDKGGLAWESQADLNKELSGTKAYNGGTDVNGGTLAIAGVASRGPASSSTATPEEAKPGQPYSGLAEREMVRRQDAVSEGERLLTEGRDAYAKGDYQQAVDSYSRSREKFPDAPMMADRRDSSQEHLNDASVALAAQNRKVGKYDEARKLLKNVVADDPSNEDAKRELAYLEDPIRTSPALTYEHTENVDKVRRNLYTAEGNYNLGKYDDAKKEYENVLRTDPYNSAARRGLERVASAKSDYYRAAYDHTRAELLMEVDKAWELSVPADVASNQDRAKLEDYEQYNLTGKFSAMREAKSSGDAVFPSLSPSFTAGFEQSMDYYYSESSETSPNFEGFVNFGAPIASHRDFPAPRGIIGDREFQYPTEYEPPVLPELAASDAAFPTTPATPTAWMGKDGEIKYELNTRSSSVYAFRGMDLGKPEAAPAPVPLVDLMEEISATEDPYSTFSLNISDASFQVAQASLAKGERPDPAGIKVEQFYNAVDYGDPAPAAGEPVAVSIEQSAHPVIPGRNLVRVALKTAAAGRSAAQPLRLTLLVDQSGSMVREDRRAAMDKALAGLGALLTDKDLVTVIGFARTPRLLADGRQGDKLGKLADLVNQSASEGGTNLEEAIKLAEQLADRHKLAAAQNRIVLFTDGAANLGNADPARLAEKVKVLRQKGIAFDIAGIAADGLNDELLGELARNGNGRYYVVGKGGDDNFAKQLAGAFRPAAENVKVQVRFNPERVGRYKLIGFEKDRLKTEDFRNDAVDAAELAAEEAGVAIYQVETLPGGNGELGEVSVRFRDAASAQMVERTWTISHDEKSPAFDRATPSMQLATLSMLAAQKLKGGPLADAIDFKQFADPRANVKRFYGSSGRVGEVLNMVDALK